MKPTNLVLRIVAADIVYYGGRRNLWEERKMQPYEDIAKGKCSHMRRILQKEMDMMEQHLWGNHPHEGIATL